MTYKILIVDDEPEIANILELFLTKEGFRTVKCGGGREALNIIKDDISIDLIILDGKMPGIDGPVVLREMERMEYKKPVVFLTGDIDWWAKHKKLKVSSFLSKPVDLEVLLGRINDILKINP